MVVLNDCFVYLSEAQAVCVAEPPELIQLDETGET
jgi:hypothetical protein